MSRPAPSDPRALWQAQATPEAVSPLEPEELRRRAQAFARTIRRRNLWEYLAAAFVIAFFGWHAVNAVGLVLRAGSALVVAGTAFIVQHMIRHARAASPPPRDLGESGLRFHRRELERQRDLLRSVPRWYLAPLVPGLVVLFGGTGLERLAQGGGILRLVLGLSFFAAVFLAIAGANAAAARQLERELDELPEPQPEDGSLGSRSTIASRRIAGS